jgi:3-oxoacyl-[acyl-carrier protein] reductase
METGLRDRIVLITGVDNPSGIGAATARAFVLEGAAIFVTCLIPVSDLSLIDSIRGNGGRIDGLQIDLSDPAAPPAVFDAVEEALGPVDVVVNNAAHSEQDSFIPFMGASHDWAGRELETITAESHDQHFAVNSRSSALMMAEYARRHVERGADWGRIINLSTDGAPGFPGEISYGASKAALESFSRAAAGELAQYGVTVNIVSPGPIQTGWIPPELEDEIARTIPLGRVGWPEDVADAIVLLASEQARWITGQTLHVGGGHRMV